MDLFLATAAATHCPPHCGQHLLVHVAGGGRIRLKTDARNLEEIGGRLRRERALIGQMTFDDDEGEHVCSVLIPSSRIELVIDADV